MRRLLREILLLILATVISLWAFLRPPRGSIDAGRAESAALVVSVAPRSVAVRETESAAPPLPEHADAESTANSVNPAQSPDDASVEPPRSEDTEALAAPPAELGAPEGEDEPGSAPSVEPYDAELEPLNGTESTADEPDPSTLRALMDDRELLSEARQEIESDHSKGFSTTFLAAPEDQLVIARFFGEDLVLVPRSALDPDQENPVYYRLNGDGGWDVETVHGRPPLERYRQYRDLFDYEYARLPEPLRALRRKLPVRSEIYLFAALIPVQEWAVVVGRRREALGRSGRRQSDVRRFIFRYTKDASGSIEARVQEIQFATGKPFRPVP